MQTIKFSQFLWYTLALLFLTACGGGGSSSGTNSNGTVSPNLVWDQGNWDEKQWQ